MEEEDEMGGSGYEFGRVGMVEKLMALVLENWVVWYSVLFIFYKG